MKTTAQRVVPTKLCMSNLPIELQECIIIQFVKDPDTSFEQLKSLRLVNRTFDALCSPRVLSCIRLFSHGENVLANLRQMRALLSSKQRHHLAYPKTLLIENWRWVHVANHFMSFREMKTTGLWIPGIILNTTLLPFLYIVGFLFAPHILPVGVFNTVVRLRARHKLSHTRKLDIPNIQRVQWTAEMDDPNWTTPRTVGFLLEFPLLTELSLVMDEEQDISYYATCLSKLRNLRKLKIDVRRRQGRAFREPISQIDEFCAVVASNPMLTDLELFQTCRAKGSLSRIFSDVPIDRPLLLEHLGISDNFRDPEAILPHIRTLKSIYVRLCGRTMFMLLLQERIFPHIIRTTQLDGQFIDYISSHPGISSLSVHNVYDEITGRLILETMARHAETLEHFSTYASSLCRCFSQVQNELLFLQCTNLRQLVLRYDQFFFYLGTDAIIPIELEQALSVICRMQQSLTLVVTDMTGFKACITHCRQSYNPLMRALGGRIVYERV